MQTDQISHPAILSFSKTLGWRHNESIAGANLFCAQQATQRSLGFYSTEDSAVFCDEELRKFSLVVLNNVSGAALNNDQQRSIERWMKNGGALIALHGAGDSTLAKAWPWYEKNVLGAEFVGHTMDPPLQDARLTALAPSHPIMQGLPSDWALFDEWYSFTQAPQIDGVTHLLGIDEASYTPLNTKIKEWRENLCMGSRPAEHPLIWTVENEAGRIFYSALAHGFENYQHPVYGRLLAQAFDWALDA